MTTQQTQPDPGASGTNMHHEADIGSGEPAPGQHETDDMIRSIPAQRGNRQTADQGNAQQGGQPGQPAKP